MISNLGRKSIQENNLKPFQNLLARQDVPKCNMYFMQENELKYPHMHVYIVEFLQNNVQLQNKENYVTHLFPHFLFSIQ